MAVFYGLPEQRRNSNRLRGVPPQTAAAARTDNVEQASLRSGPAVGDVSQNTRCNTGGLS
jgi:hypothetical protein